MPNVIPDAPYPCPDWLKDAFGEYEGWAEFAWDALVHSAGRISSERGIDYMVVTLGPTPEECRCGHVTHANTKGTHHNARCPMRDKTNTCQCGGDYLDFPHFPPCPMAMRGA